MSADILRRLQDLDDDPAASAYVGDVAAEAIAEIKRLRAMTTDPEEGARQIEAMKPAIIKVGDWVRLSAGGERTMLVIELYDYGNEAECRWQDTDVHRERFPVRSLVRVASEVEAK